MSARKNFALSRTIALLAAAGLLAFMLAACQTSDPVGNVAAGPATGEAIKIIAADSSFRPNTLEAREGEEVTIEITNKDHMSHDFAIEELDLNTGSIEPGDVANATFTVQERTTTFACTYHDGMVGTIRSR